MHVEHLSADFGGIDAAKLADQSALAGVLLAAANAAGLSPAEAPSITTGAQGVSAVLSCHGGYITLFALPDDGLCFIDVAVVEGSASPIQRACDIVARRLTAREIRTEIRRRGPVTGSASHRGHAT